MGNIDKTFMYRFILLFIGLILCLSCSAAEKKEISASSIIKLLKKGNHIHFHDKIIIDDLDFSKGSDPFIFSPNKLQSEIKSNVFFSNCIFLGKVTSNGKKGDVLVKSCFRNNLIFFGCDFRGEVDFSEMIVNGLVDFSKSVFRENVNFNGIAVWSKDAYFSEIKAEKRFMTIYSSFYGNLYFISGEFLDNVSFQQTYINGDFVINNSNFQKQAGFDNMKIDGDSFFNYVVFEAFANFMGTHFLKSVDFNKTQFNQLTNFERTYFWEKDFLMNNKQLIINNDLSDEKD